jgi:hypothetical protein
MSTAGLSNTRRGRLHDVMAGHVDRGELPKLVTLVAPRRAAVHVAAIATTADDHLAFARMMLDNGRHGRTRTLSRPSVELMTTDCLTPTPKAA